MRKSIVRIARLGFALLLVCPSAGPAQYLFCASEGLATVVRPLVDQPILAKALGLRPDQKITLVQTVGYPKK